MNERSTLRKFSGFYQNNLFRIKYKFMKQKVLKNQKEIQETHDCFQKRHTPSHKLLYIYKKTSDLLVV